MKYTIALVALLGLVGTASAQIVPVPGAPGYCRWFNGIVWQTALCATVPGYSVPLGVGVGHRGFGHGVGRVGHVGGARGHH